jgi:hypothetical protein
VIDSDALLVESRRGVLYRPSLPHKVVVMRNLAPPKPGRWRQERIFPVDMPNAAPVFSVGVDRTYFTERNTTLTFDYGVLKDVQLVKGSELNSIAEIPLRVAQAITTIPAQIVQVRINRTNNEEALIAAQAKLIATLRDFRVQKKLLETTVQGALKDNDPFTLQCKLQHPDFSAEDIKRCAEQLKVQVGGSTPPGGGQISPIPVD